MRGAFCVLVVVVATSVVGRAQDASTPDLHRLLQRLDAQAAEMEQLRGRLDKYESLYAPPKQPAGAAGCPKPQLPRLPRLPVVAESCWEPSCKSKTPPKSATLRYYVDYDNGLAFRPFCPTRRKFDLKLGGWMQFRHHGFSRDVATWTDNAGVTRPVLNRNAFDIERARLNLAGFVLDPRLNYFVQLDGDTDGAHTVDFFDYVWSWQCTNRFQIQMGKRKVPASRQWLLGARRTRFADRPMANDFFRPDRTVGVFGVGRVLDNGHYQVMVGNGYSTANQPNALTDNQFTFAGTNYFDPWGSFGSQLTDYQFVEQPLVRLGHSFVYSPINDVAVGTPLNEARFQRLSDGTRLTQVGALAPGVTVSSFDVWLYGVDMAAKWRGWSVNAEAFFRWLRELEGNGPLPVTDLFQRGFYVEGGCYLIPQVLDVNVRYSQVSGQFGDASEYAAGVNLYPLEMHKFKVTFDVTSLDGSPLNNSASDILVGDDGVLFRTQVQAEF